MSRIVGGMLVPGIEPSGSCELCGTVAELRPYGPNGEKVCFPCGMKNEAAAVRAFAKRFEESDRAEAN